MNLIRIMPGAQRLLRSVVPMASLAILLSASTAHSAASKVRWGKEILRQPREWYASAEARTAAESVIQYQSPEGGWLKNTDLLTPPSSHGDVGRPTIDNGATIMPMRFLALVADATGDAKYRQAFERGMDYLFAAQYPNGGWPQYYPLREGYYSRITYNDDAMTNVLTLLRDVSRSDAPFGFVDQARREKASAALARGIEVILRSQVKQDGQLTAWCAQHDEKTLEPAWARAYEPPSLSGGETVGITRFLMSLDEPTPEIVAAIEGAVRWLRSVAMSGVRVNRIPRPDGRTERVLVDDPDAPPVWARFYELGTNRPLYLDRDSVFRYDFSEIGYERRSGYGYHGDWPAELLDEDYPRWRAQHGLQFQAASQPAAQPGVVLEEFVFESSPDFRSCHSATVLELPNGELLCAFFSGTRESHPDVEIRLSRKPAGGAWTAPVSVADGNEPRGERMSTGNPVLFRPKGGDVMLFYKVIKPDVGFLGRAKTSSDGGHAWSEARRVGDGLMGAVKNKPIQLDNGAILSPSSTEDDHGWRVHVERGTDGGKTWKLIGPINPEAKIGAIQPTLLTYPDGRIQMLCRTRSEHGFIAQSWSKDGGLTWTPLEAAVLPNNNSGFDAVTLRDGRQLLVYNHSTRTQPGMGHKGRGILNVALSRDGINWEASLILEHLDESGKQFSYPSVIQTRDGLVHIVYTWHRKRIKHVVLDPARLETTPMPEGEWPAKGPFSLEAASLQARWRAQHGL